MISSNVRKAGDQSKNYSKRPIFYRIYSRNYVVYVRNFKNIVVILRKHADSNVKNPEPNISTTISQQIWFVKIFL